MNVVDRVRADRDRWRRRFYQMQAGRDYWKGRAHDLQLKLEAAERPVMTERCRGTLAYLHEDDRVAARRRTWRESKRRHRTAA